MKKEKEAEPGILHQTVAELYPDQYNQINQIFGFVKDMKNDPYSTTLTALAKLTTLADGSYAGGVFFCFTFEYF